MFEESSSNFQFEITLSRKATFIILKSKSAVSVYEHKIAECVNYKDYKLRQSTFTNYQQFSENTNWKFYAEQQ